MTWVKIVQANQIGKFYLRLGENRVCHICQRIYNQSTIIFFLNQRAASPTNYEQANFPLFMIRDTDPLVKFSVFTPGNDRRWRYWRVLSLKLCPLMWLINLSFSVIIILETCATQKIPRSDIPCAMKNNTFILLWISLKQKWHFG